MFLQNQLNKFVITKMKEIKKLIPVEKRCWNCFLMHEKKKFIKQKNSNKRGR